MALQWDTTLRNTWLDAIETALGTSPILEIRSGSPPANTGAADTGTLLASITCPADWLAAAASGSKAMSGTWQDLSADASGTPGHFRLKTSGGVCKGQGTAGTSGTDMILDAGTLTAGQQFNVTTFTITAPGA